MPKARKIAIKAALVFLALVLVASLAHFLIFPQETKSLLVGFSELPGKGRVHYSKATPQEKVDSLVQLIRQASARVSTFWPGQYSDPRFIFCNERRDFEKYSVNPEAPAVTYLKLGSVIVLSADALDLDIIAHEMSHAEFYERIGFYAFNQKVPAWFKHGLAMQCDLRDYYSEDTLRARTDGFRNLPDIRSCTTDAQFYSGAHDQVKLHYMAARYEVGHWYSKAKLEKLVKELNEGKSFGEAMGK